MSPCTCRDGAGGEETTLQLAVTKSLTLERVRVRLAWRRARALTLLNYELLPAEYLPEPRLQRCLCRTLASPVEPVFKILNFDDVGELGISDLHGDRGQAFADIADPVVTAGGGKGLGHSLVERFGRHLERMRGLVQVVDDDSAGFEGHEGNLSYSLFVRLPEDQARGE
jgi:hypothetical protein